MRDDILELTFKNRFLVLVKVRSVKLDLSILLKDLKSVVHSELLQFLQDDAKDFFFAKRVGKKLRC